MNQQFKSGDWVKQVKENYSDYLICFKIKAIVDDTTYTVESNIFDIDAIQNTNNHFELWAPIKDEWCWFKAINNFPVLVQYTGEVFKDQYKVKHNSDSYFWVTELKPFIGQLPTN